MCQKFELMDYLIAQDPSQARNHRLTNILKYLSEIFCLINQQESSKTF